MSASKKQTRLQRLIKLYEGRGIGVRVALWEVQREAGAQHGARHKEARSLGYVITNELERTADGELHSWYTLRVVPPKHQERAQAAGHSAMQTLFGDIAPLGTPLADVSKDEMLRQRRLNGGTAR